MMNLNPAPRKRTADRQKLHPLIWAVLLSTIISCFGGRLFDKSISGYGWIVPLLVALLSLLKGPKSFKFPLMLWLPWLPWICVVVVYQLFADAANSLQRSIMFLTPLVVGIATSRLRIDEQGLHYFLKLCRFSAGALILIILYKTNLFLSGTLPFRTGLAPEVITGSILCVIFASSYVLGNIRDSFWWAAIATIPVIAVTRMGMVGAAISLPFTLAPMKLAKRILFIGLVITFGITLFFTERIQQKMFYSGQGRLSDIKWENPDFATSGRSFIWGRMKEDIAESPWFGKGANESEALVTSMTEGLTHPHNDWLRLAYDYGYFGATLFGLTLIWQLIDLFNKARRSTGITSLLFYAGASSMLIFALFMLTDNIILYASFFGNLQFTVLGLAYASYQKSAVDIKSIPHMRRHRIKW